MQIDLEAALALTKDLADAREFDRHHGNIAHELAGRDPAQAERVLAMVKDRFQRDHYAVRVVYRMAPLDLARARRLAESISDECLKGYALGMMALRLAEAGKDSAREVLESCLRIARAFVPGQPGAIQQALRHHLHRGRSAAGRRADRPRARRRVPLAQPGDAAAETLGDRPRRSVAHPPTCCWR